jgi:hypothetical protein
VEHFAQGALETRYGLGDDLATPLIGYFGSWASWFDVDLVRTVAQKHPEWTFVLIGSGPADMSGLSQLANVKLIGEVPYHSLPAYLSEFDACIIPFKLLPVTATTDPVKFYEYLAAGKPVIATDLPELRPYRDMVCLAGTPSEFEQSIKRALAEDTDDKRRQRKAFAQRHSWPSRFLDYDQEIRELSGAHVVSRTVEPGTSYSTSPVISEIEPSALRVHSGFEHPAAPPTVLHVRGWFLTPACAILVDEQCIPTEFISSTELCCQVPADLCAAPGCFMVSVIDQTTWKQSNRRVLLVEGV